MSALTERDMLNLLRQRYTRLRNNKWPPDRYVRAEHVAHIQSHLGAPVDGIADYMVMDTYHPCHLHGFEVKVSRADWLRELKDPEKCERWKRYCDRWWLVVPDLNIVKGDLPDDWGLLAIDKHGQLRAYKGAPKLSPKPIPRHALGQLLRAVAQTTARELAAIPTHIIAPIGANYESA
jgi:hypothetical protein